MFLRNVRWYPSDDPSVSAGRLKAFLLWAFPRMITFYMAVALTAMYVGYRTSGVERRFVQRDLMAFGTQNDGIFNASTAANVTHHMNGGSAHDTILRSAVRQHIVPFQMNFSSTCSAKGNGDALLGLPSIKEVRSTNVVYGFPSNDWNAEALPFGLQPTHSVRFQFGDVKKSIANATKKFRDFQKRSDISWPTMYELLVQGKLMYERSVSDSAPWQAYHCSDTNGSNKSPLNTKGKPTRSKRVMPRRKPRSLKQVTDTTKVGKPSDDWYDYDEEEDAGQLCFGARSSLADVTNVTDARRQSLDEYFSLLVNGFARTTEVPNFDDGSVSLIIDKYAISSQLTLTSLTVDLPYAKGFGYTSDDSAIFDKYCHDKSSRAAFLSAFGAGTIKPSDLDRKRQAYCDRNNTAYLEPRATCGHSNCIFLDQSMGITFKKQLQLMPYLTNCSTGDLTYDLDYLNMFPRGCIPHRDAVFLFGLGSYISAESFDSGYETKVPFIGKPQRHIMVTFAKLEWKMTDLSSALGAECGVNATSSSSRCQGLLYNLEGISKTTPDVSSGADESRRVLLLGESHLPEARMATDYRNPVQLVSLNTRPFYYAQDDMLFEWEHINLQRMRTTNWPETIKAQGGLNGTLCSLLVDSYIAQIEANHWFIDDPRQPLYAAAIFYLFQNASVKTVKLDTMNKTNNVVMGTTALKGDLERHDIRFSIPLVSLISTFIGLALFLFVALMTILYPTERLRMTEDSDENSADRYDRFLQEEYPTALFTRRLKLVSSDRVAADDYEVQSATLQFVDDPEKKLYI